MIVKELVRSCAIRNNTGKVKIINCMNMDDKYIGDWEDIKETPLANFEVTRWTIKQSIKGSAIEFMLIIEVK